MAYRALRSLTVGNVQKERGDAIPEAMDWPNLQAWLRNGFIEEVPDPEPPKPKAAAPSRAPAKKAPAKKKTPPKKTKE